MDSTYIARFSASYSMIKRSSARHPAGMDVAFRKPCGELSPHGGSRRANRMLPLRRWSRKKTARNIDHNLRSWREKMNQRGERRGQS